MSDVPFPCQASCSARNTRVIVRHPSTVDTNHPGKDCTNQQDDTAVKGSQTESPFPGPEEEVPVPVGTKRTRGFEEPEDKYSSAPTTGEVCFETDPVSIIATGTKRLRMSDRAADDRDNELRHSLIIKKHQEEQDSVLQAKALIIPEISSLSGLSEELIIKIFQELTITDIMALRRTNKRLAYVTRARILWIIRLCQLLDHLNFAQSPATFLPSQLSSYALENITLRPHIFDYKWLRSIACHPNPIKSKVLSTNWSEPENIRLPILMPGGRWLVATCDDGRSSNSSICLWDLDNGTLKWLPEAQMIAEGRIWSLDMKMDQKGTFAFLAVLSVHEVVAPPAASVYQVDVYKVVFKTDAESSSFHKIDSISLDTRQGSEVQIYPQHGRVIVDLFDRVFLWGYAPMNMCAWMPTSRQPRLFHRCAHAITHTHRYILVADGDESELRVFNLPPPFIRPAQLRDLPLFIVPASLVFGLPFFSVSLRFSTDRLVDISTRLEIDNKPLRLPAAVQATTVGTNIHMGNNTHQGAHDRMSFCFDPTGRGFLFIDAASCDSYLLYSYPIHEISLTTGSPNALSVTSMQRGHVWEQARSGSPASSGSSSTNNRFLFSPHTGRWRDSVSPNALWVGAMGGISSALTGDSSPRYGARNVVLLQSPHYDGSLIILSTTRPPTVDLGPNQSIIADIEQGVAKTVLCKPLDESVGAGTGREVRVEEASVDEISGKVCIVETTSMVDRITNRSHVRCGLRLLEYA